MEALFGTTAPMWTSLPPTFGALAPVAGSGPLGASLFGAPALSSNPAGVLSSPQLTPPNTYGYGGSLVAIAPPGVPELTPSALLAAVALRRGQPQGPTNDQEVEEFIYDALELLPGASDVEIRCENGRATLTGAVPNKRLKHDVGEIAWTIPVLNDVQNNVTIASRRRGRASNREQEGQPSGQARKQG